MEVISALVKYVSAIIQESYLENLSVVSPDMSYGVMENPIRKLIAHLN